MDKAGYPDLEAAIAKNVDEAKLINHPEWTIKLVQVCVIYNTIKDFIFILIK